MHSLGGTNAPGKTKRGYKMITVQLKNGAKIELTLEQFLKSNLPAVL